MNPAAYREAADHYRTLGWRTGTLRTAVWTITSHPVEALDTPAELGRHTYQLFRHHMPTVPIFRARDHDHIRWVFLTGRREPGWHELASQLTTLDVEHIWADATLDLPPTRIGQDELTWLIPPTSSPLPSFALIAQALLDAAKSLSPNETSYDWRNCAATEQA